jgi:O-antigen ligase/cytochrome c-type biogenesis protein CcmH/NrfG
MKDFLKAVVYGGLFIIPFLTLYVANDYFFPYITGKNFTFRIIVEVIFVAWALLALLDTKYRPKFSWVLSGFSVLLIVMFFANLLGQHPQSSFWSNFERMDGYVTLVHIFLYTVVLGSTLTTKKAWNTYLYATLTAATITAIYGVAQYTGAVGEVAGRRIESYLGNAAYLSIYMLFHIFIAFWMFVESKNNLHRIAFLLLAALFTFALMNSGTRGTVLGFGVGLGVMVTYIMLFGAQYREFRKYAIGAFIFLIVGLGIFIGAKDQPFIQDNPNLARVANIDLASDLKVRGTIWMMAWEGVKERPLLGWGQSNFNYVFNEQYQPFLYDQEQWFDRPHSIVFDWLISGGFLGLLAYLSIFAACIYYIFLLPLINKEDKSFTALERGVLLGILAGYFTHNLVVFDNIVSYIFFGLLLALIHSRVATPIPSVESVKVDDKLMTQFFAPIALVLLVAIVYLVNVPSMGAAKDIIAGYGATSSAAKLAAFERAVSRNSFAHQEIAEQIAQQAMAIANDPKVTDVDKQKYVAIAERELLRLIAEKPGDARVHVFVSTFYRSIGDLEGAKTHMDIARELSPKKQSIISQQAIIAYSQGNLEASRDYFGEAFKLDERNMEARVFYSALLLLTGDTEAAKALANDRASLVAMSKNEFYLNTVNQIGDFGYLMELYKVKVEEEPSNEQNWVSLAFLYNQMGDTKAAADTLRQAGEEKPTFAKVANCIADNIEAGNEPEAGCQ